MGSLTLQDQLKTNGNSLRDVLEVFLVMFSVFIRQ